MSERVHRPSISIRIGRRLLSTLLDTGACVSLIRRATYDSLPSKYKFRLKPSINRVTTLDGTRIPDLGCGYFWVPLFKTHIIVYIIRELEFDLLLGHDALSRVGASLNCSLNYMELPTGQILPFERPCRARQSQVTVVSSTFNARKITSVVTPVIEQDVDNMAFVNSNSNEQVVTDMNTNSAESTHMSKQTKAHTDDLSYAKKTDEILPTGYKVVDEVLAKNKDIFRSGNQPLGNCTISPIKIKTTGPPIAQAVYREPLSKRQFVQNAVREMAEQKVIRPSESPWSSPVTLVPKKDGGTRFCIDYRKVNKVTTKDRYPLPRIQDIFDQIGGSKIFSTLDLRSGYWQIPVHRNSIDKTAFICSAGLWEWTKMPFGLCNAPGHFQRCMNNVLSEVLGKFALVYIDDIVIYSKTPEEHAKHLDKVFKLLKKADLYLKSSKCFFAQKQILLLGYVVSEKGISCDPAKVKAISELSPPSDIGAVRRFLGLTGYYRQCIKGYAKIAEPLVRLTRKHQMFKWGKDQQNAFEILKKALISAPIMAYPDPTKEYKLFTDASKTSIGAILVQESEDGVERVIQYLSHQLSGPKLKWAAIEKEAYAVVYSIEKLRPYLYGSKFTVYTDHKPLKSLFTKSMNNTKIQRWSVLLSEYGADIQYHRGPLNIRADMLSRITPNEQSDSGPVAVLEIDENNENNDGENIVNEEIDIPTQIDGLNLDEVQREREQHAEFQELRNLAEQDDSDYILKNGLLYTIRKPRNHASVIDRLVLPPVFQKNVIARAHKEVGHQGVAKTFFKLLVAYKWPKMTKTINSHIKTCPQCVAYHRRPQYVPMGEMPIPAMPNQFISLDLIGPFTESERGHKYCLTMIDHCTGWTEVFPIPNKTNKSVWTAFADQYLPRHGIPAIILTDNGSEFCAESFEQYLRQLHIQHKKTTPYHPASNGRLERFHRSFKQMLEKAIRNNPTTWDDHISDVLLAHRVSISSVTGHTPFYLTYGRHPRTPIPAIFPQGNEQYHRYRFGNQLAEALLEARERTADSRKYNRERLAKRANTDSLRVGDSVIVKAEHRTTFTSRWDPKYIIIAARPPTYTVQNQQTGKVKTLHREKLTLVDPNIIWDELPERPKRNFQPDMGPIRLNRQRNNANNIPDIPNEPQDLNNVQDLNHVDPQPDAAMDNDPNIVAAPQQSDVAAGTDEMDSDSLPGSLPEPFDLDHPNMETFEPQPSASPMQTHKERDKITSDAKPTSNTNEARPAVKRRKLAQSTFKSTSQVDSSSSASDSDNIFLGTDTCLYRPAKSRDTQQQTYKRRLRTRIPKVKYYGYPQQNSDSDQ